MNKTVDVVLRAPRPAASVQELARAMADRRGVRRVERNVVVPGSERASRRHWPELANGIAGVVMIWSDDIDALAPPGDGHVDHGGRAGRPARPAGVADEAFQPNVAGAGRPDNVRHPEPSHSHAPLVAGP